MVQPGAGSERKGNEMKSSGRRRVEPKPKMVIPRSLIWIIKVLRRGYSQLEILAILSDLARILRTRKNEKGLSQTACIVCRGWIPVRREDRGQHTCSEDCQRLYRLWRRAKLAAKFCRYCKRPVRHPEFAKLGRPKRKVRIRVQTDAQSAEKGYGAASRSIRQILSVKDSISIVPSAPEGVGIRAIEEAVEARDGIN